MSLSITNEALFEQTPLRSSDVVFKSHSRARRYVARIDKDGNIVITVPKVGTRREALAFANLHREWLKGEQAKVFESLRLKSLDPGLSAGDEIWFRGEKVQLRLEKDFGRPVLCFANHRIYIADESMDLARPLREYLRSLASREIPGRLWALAEKIGNRKVKKVTVRDQKTRWGSCSTSGTISLNWRLILVPPAARDYVIYHELMHTKRFDHSPKFWALVASVCPRYQFYENWLREHQDELNW